MAGTVGIGIQDFAEIITNDYFYVDKTHFIKEWWERGDFVTLIARPHHFGKTLNMSMMEQFFSVEYAERKHIFEGLCIFEEEKYRDLQGTRPVISLSFAKAKGNDYITIHDKICEILRNLYIRHSFLRDSDVLIDADRKFFDRMLSLEVDDVDATFALYKLSNYLYRYYGKKVIILLDEYDTPLQEAYVNGFLKEMEYFTGSLFLSSFKTNKYLNRGIMTGITNVSNEYMELNNLKVVTTTSNEYADCFGFTEKEVFAALEECGLESEKEKVKCWYDGFTFGSHTDIYHPWSILNFLNKGIYETYWANTSSNDLVGKLIREGCRSIKTVFETLLQGESIRCPIDERIVYNQWGVRIRDIWNLLLASGYLKVVSREKYGSEGIWNPKYELELTNLEVKVMFRNMIQAWFQDVKSDYNDFVEALLLGDVKAMNNCMNRVALATYSCFDTGNSPSGAEPEKFYHGFVLGLMVELADHYTLTSNRESGFGRYDVMIEPKNNDKTKDAFILEFKVHDPEEEADLKETVQVALQQIEEKQYAASLMAKGIPAERIRTYGFAFEGKKVLIG